MAYLRHLFQCAFLLLIIPAGICGQTPPSVCTPAALAALKELPKLNYTCSTRFDDFDERVLTLPPRRTAIRDLVAQLGLMKNQDWWSSPVSELNACDFSHSAGEFTEEQAQQFRDSYVVRLLGDDSVRLVVVSDPCYQTGFGGSNLYLLHRDGERVSVTEAVDGFYSRADNAVQLSFAEHNGRRVVEIVTGTGGLQPYATNYYFSVDLLTKKLAPLKLFQVGKQTSNKITSAVLMSDPAPAATELQVVVNGRTARTFLTYGDDAHGRIDDNGRSLTRQLWRWNGRFFVPSR